jgi:hypothetical protein
MTTTMKRKGKALNVLLPGARRRISDGKNAWRKMTPEQRQVFMCWIDEVNLPVAGQDEP